MLGSSQEGARASHRVELRVVLGSGVRDESFIAMKDLCSKHQGQKSMWFGGKRHSKTRATDQVGRAERGDDVASGPRAHAVLENPRQH